MFWCFYVSATFVRYLNNTKTTKLCFHPPHPSCVCFCVYGKHHIVRNYLWKFCTRENSSSVTVHSAGVLFVCILGRHKITTKKQQQTEHNMKREQLCCCLCDIIAQRALHTREKRILTCHEIGMMKLTNSVRLKPWYFVTEITVEDVEAWLWKRPCIADVHLQWEEVGEDENFGKFWNCVKWGWGCGECSGRACLSDYEIWSWNTAAEDAGDFGSTNCWLHNTTNSEWARENRIKLPTGIFHQLKLVFKMKSFRWRELGWRCWVGELSDDDKRPWEIFHVKNHSLIYTLCDSLSFSVKLAPLSRRYLSPQSSIDAELKSNFHINREYT